ncbi:hypothetical protein H1C71_021275, partial [Ictidomys tridecemlineatus]
LALPGQSLPGGREVPGLVWWGGLAAIPAGQGAEVGREGPQPQGRAVGQVPSRKWVGQVGGQCHLWESNPAAEGGGLASTQVTSCPACQPGPKARPRRLPAWAAHRRSPAHLLYGSPVTELSFTKTAISWVPRCSPGRIAEPGLQDSRCPTCTGPVDLAFLVTHRRSLGMAQIHLWSGGQLVGAVTHQETVEAVHSGLAQQGGREKGGSGEPCHQGGWASCGMPQEHAWLALVGLEPGARRLGKGWGEPGVSSCLVSGGPGSMARNIKELSVINRVWSLWASYHRAVGLLAGLCLKAGQSSLHTCETPGPGTH